LKVLKNIIWISCYSWSDLWTNNITSTAHIIWHSCPHSCTA